RNNNATNLVNVNFAYQVRNQYNQLVFNFPLTSSGRNIEPNSDSFELFAPLQLDTFSGKTPSISVRYVINPLALDFTPNNYNTISNNNIYTKTTHFGNKLIYDDGTAEGGYGLDYGSLPAGPGYAAIKFVATKADTLRGISVFFNRSVADVAFKSFDIMVWKSISEPPANTDDNDVILKQVNLASVFYSDSINGFVDIIFDTAVALSSDDFYIGWKQNINFILNVGYDNNYKYLHAGGRNPNLFYNLNGYWESVNSTITGVPMMRPIVGAPVPKSNTSIKQTTPKSPTVNIYPNPIDNTQTLNINSDNLIVSAKVFDMNSRCLIDLYDEDIKGVPISILNAGIYFIELTNALGQVNRIKFIVN
ncbi:MAG: T9SS type A sorting domain-containing protein, partial [Bacteroidia bacterium]|nr:T9SS type A sorting domain-containing protein [Bacteroidia bacterium]